MNIYVFSKSYLDDGIVNGIYNKVNLIATKEDSSCIKKRVTKKLLLFQEFSKASHKPVHFNHLLL